MATVSELIELLNSLPNEYKNSEVILAKDEEGNGFKKWYAHSLVTYTGSYNLEVQDSNNIGSDYEDGQPGVVLWP